MKNNRYFKNASLVAALLLLVLLAGFSSSCKNDWDIDLPESKTIEIPWAEEVDLASTIGNFEGTDIVPYIAYYCVSDDNSIVSISGYSTLKGMMPGTTSVRVYKDKDHKDLKCTLTVKVVAQYILNLTCGESKRLSEVHTGSIYRMTDLTDTQVAGVFDDDEIVGLNPGQAYLAFNDTYYNGYLVEINVIRANIEAPFTLPSTIYRGMPVSELEEILQKQYGGYTTATGYYYVPDNMYDQTGTAYYPKSFPGATNMQFIVYTGRYSRGNISPNQLDIIFMDTNASSQTVLSYLLSNYEYSYGYSTSVNTGGILYENGDTKWTIRCQDWDASNAWQSIYFYR